MKYLTMLTVTAGILASSFSTASAYTERQERYLDRLVIKFQSYKVKNKDYDKVEMGADVARCRVNLAVDEYGIDAVMKFAANPDLRGSPSPQSGEIYRFIIGLNNDGTRGGSSGYCPAPKKSSLW